MNCSRKQFHYDNNIGDSLLWLFPHSKNTFNTPMNCSRTSVLSLIFTCIGNTHERKQFNYAYSMGHIVAFISSLITYIGHTYELLNNAMSLCLPHATLLYRLRVHFIHPKHTSDAPINCSRKHFLNRTYSLPEMAAILNCQQFIYKIELMLFVVDLIRFLDIGTYQVHDHCTFTNKVYWNMFFFVADILIFLFCYHKRDLTLFGTHLIGLFDLNNVRIKKF